MPPISPYEQSLIEVLFDCGPTVIAGMGGHSPIGEADILAYRLNRGVILTGWECGTIRRFSRIYAAALGEYYQASAPKPWVQEDDRMHDRVGQQIASVFAGLRSAK